MLPLARELGDLVRPSEEDWQMRMASEEGGRRQREADVVASCVEMFFLVTLVVWCCSPEARLRSKHQAGGVQSPEMWQRRWIERAA